MVFDDIYFRCPTNLRTTTCPIRRVLLVGTCLSDLIGQTLITAFGIESDFLFINSVCWHNTQPPRELGEYDMIVANIPLLITIPDAALFQLPLSSSTPLQRLYSSATAKLLELFESILNLTRISGLPTFVCNFMVPQQYSAGRLHPGLKYPDARLVIEMLNRRLALEVSKSKDCHILDLDQIASSIGKRNILDDFLWASNHNAPQTNYDFEKSLRVQGGISSEHALTKPLSEINALKTDTFFSACAHELLSMMRTIRGTDLVKLVVIDLDETLWPGIAAESGEAILLDGLYVGFLESLATLKWRGILLGIISKNDPETVEAIWSKSVASLLPLSDFSFLKIGWSDKASSMAQILSESEIAPHHTIFIDTCARERAEVQSAFPEIRTLGENIYDMRRVLLWSPETQTHSTTSEGARRHTLLKEKRSREASRKEISRDEFLSTLDLEVHCQLLLNADSLEAARLIELINRTTQFNTTGAPCDYLSLKKRIEAGGHCVFASARDKFSNYGIISAALVEGSRITQWVLSCRVFGLGIEEAILHWLKNHTTLSEGSTITLNFNETPRNGLARRTLEAMHFTGTNDGAFVITLDTFPPFPSHITIKGATPWRALP